MTKSTLIPALALIVSGSAQAQNVGILGEGACNYPTIGVALLSAQNGDVIVVPRNTTAGAQLGIVLKDVTIATGNSGCTAEDSTKAFRAVIEGVQGNRIADIQATVTFRNVKVRNGFADEGGLFRVVAGDLTIDNSELSGGDATFRGGAISVNSGSLTVTGWSEMTDNSATDGGAIFVGPAADAELWDTTLIAGNSAVDGGGVFVRGGSLLMRESSTIRTNTASNNGGGVAMEFDGASLIVNDTAEIGDSSGFWGGNHANGDGGGIFASTGSVTLLADAAITDNTSSAAGGGVTLEQEHNFVPPAEISFSGNAIIEGNSATVGGGGLVLRDGALAEQPEVRGNSTDGHGGGVLIEGDATVQGGLIIENTAQHGGGVAMLGVDSGDEALFTDVRIRNNTATDEGGGIWTDSGFFRIEGTGGLSDCDFRPAPGTNAYCADIRLNDAALGGAIATSGEMEVVRTAVRGNDATATDAVEVKAGGDVVLANVLLVNSGGTGSTTPAVAVSDGGNLDGMHVTVASNDDGVLYELGSTGTFKRSIIADGGTLEIQTAIAFPAPALNATCSMFDGAIVGPWTGSDVDEFMSPGFVTTARGNFRIDSSSNAADQCSNGLPNDLDNASRVANFDRGAFEAP